MHSMLAMLSAFRAKDRLLKSWPELGDGVADARKQPRDQSALHQKHGTEHQNLYAILFPCGLTTKENLASRGQAALANPPALHLPPVILRRSKSDRRYFDVARVLAAKNANGNLGRPSAYFEHRDVWAANNLTAEEGIRIAENRCVGDSMKPCQRYALFVRDTRRIDHHQLPEDRGLRWERSGVLQCVFEREIVVPSK